MKKWITDYKSAMLYKLLILFVSLTMLSGQSLFNRWIGTNPFMGSARSSAMGSTHLLNSRGSTNTRSNPANLISLDSQFGFNFQIDRLSTFERWSQPMRDSFDEHLVYGDYVANEFSYYGFRGGLSTNVNVLNLGRAGFGFHYAPLTHFKYYYSEEVRGSYRIEDGEYASKDPNVGYHNLSIEGAFMVSSLGGGIQLYKFGDIILNVGSAIHSILSTKISDRVEVDSLYSNVTNLSTYPDIQKTAIIPRTNFITLSAQLNLKSYLEIATSWESKAELATNNYDWHIDSTSSLLQYWNDSINEDSIFYAVKGINYIKPELKTIAFNYFADTKKRLSISFEMNQISYNGHLNLSNYKQYKFGFEYITQMGTPIRGGLLYRTAAITAMKPISMFTFGSGKSIGNLVIDVAGTYCFQSFSYPDLFPVGGDARSSYDLVRDSQFNLQIAFTYQF